MDKTIKKEKLKELMTPDQYNAFTESAKCIIEGCGMPPPTYQELYCHKHDKEGTFKDYRKCIKSECYNLVLDGGFCCSCTNRENKHQESKPSAIDLKPMEIKHAPAIYTEDEYNGLAFDYDKLNKAYDKLFDSFMRLNDLNDKLINKLLN